MPSPRLSRRQCLKALGAGAAALAAAPLAGCGAPSARRTRPNVIFILADDLGWGDLGCYGGADVRTPHLDGLAAAGARLSRFYVNAPVCMPSRLSFLTGRLPNRGIDPSRGMAAGEVTLAEMFRAAGYRTALFGKWHLGIPLDLSPNQQGFDEFVGFKNGAMDNYSHYFYWGGIHRHVLFRDEAPLHEDGTYFPDIVVRETRRFIRSHRDQPFFLYLPFNMPHYPLQPPAGSEAAFGHIADEQRRLYVAFLAALDERIGQVLACVDDEGLRQDTIVIFASDHGPSTEERGGGGSAGGLRGAKDSLWEGGLRVPLLCAWPGVIPAGVERSQPAMSIDLLPTLAAYCGVDAPARVIDGRSLVPVLARPDAPPPRTQMNWVHGESWAVREGRFKLHVQSGNGVLLDLDADPGESRSVGQDHEDLATRLAQDHQRWRTNLLRGEPVS